MCPCFFFPSPPFLFLFFSPPTSDATDATDAPPPKTKKTPHESHTTDPPDNLQGGFRYLGRVGGHPRRLLAAVHPDRPPEARRDEATAAFARVVLAREVRGGRVSEVSFED